MWFGTGGGLNRYDGYRFTSFPSEPDMSAGPGTVTVRTLAEDRDGLLWIGTVSGGLLAYDPRRRTTRVLLDGLCFANGVALAPDESFVLVVETSCYRVRRLWLRGEREGRSEEFIGGLPGFPDGVTGDGQGRFWLTLVSPRVALLDALHPYPALKKALLRMPAVLQPGPVPYGFVLGLDGDGRVVSNLQDPGGTSVAFATNAVAHGPWLYLGRLEGRSVSRFPLARAMAP